MPLIDTWEGAEEMRCVESTPLAAKHGYHPQCEDPNEKRSRNVQCRNAPLSADAATVERCPRKLEIEDLDPQVARTRGRHLKSKLSICAPV